MRRKNLVLSTLILFLVSVWFVVSVSRLDTSTPENTVETAMNAVLKGDVETFASYMDAGFFGSEEKQIEYYRDYLNKSPIQDFEVIDSKEVTDSFFEVVVQMEYANGEIEQLPAKVKLIDDKWKITNAEYEPGEIKQLAEPQ
ncbi:nuclear transport factor 2 family protein [Gracilibacillus massiliensis]|uniref:DUF4878 domain-containing protein n=1 Tax=Gracilibacillus massiliensis TaxID=1564956 RepID=UPI00071D5225|nr:DUF4878 domain-containing protein [Gracilibacillus massiliensis]